MVLSCCAIGCANRYNKKSQDSGISYHRLPKDPNRQKMWLNKLKRKNFDPSQMSSLYICSAHFQPSDYDVSILASILRDKIHGFYFFIGEIQWEKCQKVLQ